MTQRLKNCQNTINLETLACEKYISRLLNKDKPTTASLVSQKTKEKYVKLAGNNQNQINRARPNVKQQNLPSPKSNQSPNNLLQYADDSALVEVTVKTTNPRQRSRSTTVDREPWGQLLKQQRSGDKISVFGNFDPLRTLHFLAKELQYHLQALLPDDNSVQQMVADMQYALKRVPPEVASSVHLQQALELLPSRKSSKMECDKPEKLKPVTSEQVTQTPPSTDKEAHEKLQQIMEQSTLKLEASCRQMEALCTQLKDEKEALEKQLQTEKETISYLNKKITDLEIENNDILLPRMKSLEEDKRRLESEFTELARKFENQAIMAATELKNQLIELKTSKLAAEQECAKLRHQLRLNAIEKEKYIAVLAVRDKQINEIRSEMSQLQQVVNDQLVELHNNAMQAVPSNGNIATSSPNSSYDNKENIGDIGDGSVSTIYNTEDQRRDRVSKMNDSFKDLPSGDVDISSFLKDLPEKYIGKKEAYLEKLDSQTSIRSMFSEIKKTAYAVANFPRERSEFNLLSNIP